MKNGKYTDLILKAKKDEKELQRLLSLFEPLIKAYSKKLFFMEMEDARQEILLALIEAIQRIGECKSDGQCLTYINNAVKYKYASLCRQSIRKKEAEEAYTRESQIKTAFHEKYGDIETMYDLEKKNNFIKYTAKNIRLHNYGIYRQRNQQYYWNI